MAESGTGIDRKKKILLIVAGIAVLLILAGAGTALAANSAVPGDALYPLDRQLEALQLRLSTNRTRTYQQLAEERLSEVQALATRGDEQRLQQAMLDLNQALLNAGQSMAQSSSPAAGQSTPQPSDLAKGKPEQPGKSDQNNKKDDDQPKEPRTNPLCTVSETEQPAIRKLAEEMQVSYEEVLAWYCQGLGIGEIKLAYTISQQAGVSVTEIVSQRLSGKGWGQIMQDYQLKGKGKPAKAKPKQKP